MLKYDEVIELRKRFTNGEITLDTAKELLWKDFKVGKRSWHTKDWKERRAKVIKDNCEICGSNEVLTLQHLSHPKRYFEYEKEVAKLYTQSFIDSNKEIDRDEFIEHLTNMYDYDPIPLCPSCKKRKPNKRMRKTPQYLCLDCKNEFDKPIYKSIEDLVTIFYSDSEAIEVRDKCFTSKSKWRNRHNLSGVRYWMQRERAQEKDSQKIGAEAIILYLDDTIKYLSFEDTITACRKCASNFDLNNMELCPNCKKNYKGGEYATCIQCLPEDKRKKALQKIAFGKSMHDMHKKLGID
jgi:hypothetical protein